MKTVAIITCIGKSNFGNRLQNYALHKVLTDYGFKVDTLKNTSLLNNVEDYKKNKKEYIHYRNKVHAVLTRTKDGKVLPGIYEEGTHRVLPVKGCMIENEKAAEIIQSTAKLIQDFKIKVYNEDSGYGLVRHLLVRMAVIPER